MYSLMGVTGRVGGRTAARLCDAGVPVRAIVRDATKGDAWRQRGCEVAVADIDDVTALVRAFDGADGVFVMIPPDYDPAPGFPQVRQFIANIREAVMSARPGKLVFLSTVGAHVEAFSLLNNGRMVEQALRELPIPTAFVRAAWFMENASGDVSAAREGMIPSYLQPLDHCIPMVATADIAQTIATLLQEQWEGPRVVELEGPRRYSANDIAEGFAKALGHPVRTKAVPRATWEHLFLTQGMRHPEPRMRMLDGFNDGWIDFEHGEAGSLKATTPLDAVLRDLVERSP